MKNNISVQKNWKDISVLMFIIGIVSLLNVTSSSVIVISFFGKIESIILGIIFIILGIYTKKQNKTALKIGIIFWFILIIENISFIFINYIPLLLIGLFVRVALTIVLIKPIKKLLTEDNPIK